MVSQILHLQHYSGITLVSACVCVCVVRACRVHMACALCVRVCVRPYVCGCAWVHVVCACMYVLQQWNSTEIKVTPGENTEQLFSLSGPSRS